MRAAVAVGVGEHLVHVAGGDVVAWFGGIEAFVFRVDDEGEMVAVLKGDVGFE